MKRPLGISLLVGLLLAIVTPVIAGSTSSRLLPEGDPETLRVRIGGKWSSYHVATREVPIEVSVRGPGSVRLLSRLLFANDPPAAPARYEICLEIDGVKIRTLEAAVNLSAKARLPEGGPVGSLERHLIQIPEGTHRALIYPVQEGDRVALRLFHGTGQTKKVKYVPFAPDSYIIPILLHSGDSEVIYYRFDRETPAAFSVNGPLRMKALTRLDFNHERGYSQSYAIKVSIDGDLCRTVRLRAQASSTSIYPDRTDITPGVGRELMIDVPEGRHEVTLALDCTTADAASLKLLIPEKAVTNGP